MNTILDDYPGLKKGEVSTGTTIMAVKYDGGVILGADSRTSSGTYVVNRVADKITPISDNIYICRSGSAADTQALADYVRDYLSRHTIELDRPPTVKAAGNLLRAIAYPNKDALLAGMIIAGWDPYDGPMICNMPLGGTLMEDQPFAIGGSGSTFIYGYVDGNYKENMTKQECMTFVSNAVAHAMARDGSSGGIIRLCVIDESGVERHIINGNELPYGP